MTGLIQLVPEYSGSALDFMNLGRRPATSDTAATYRSLARLAAGRGLVAARSAPAQDANAIVVTAATAARYHLRSIADLARQAPDLVFGGPPECQERADCLLGLERAYGLRFKAFTATDTGGPLTTQALVAGQIGVGLLFTTDPDIQARHLVILADSRALQPAENVTPLVRRDTVRRYGPQLLAALDAVSDRLTTSTLRSLDARVELTGLKPRKVADSWLRNAGADPGKAGGAMSEKTERTTVPGRPGPAGSPGDTAAQRARLRRRPSGAGPAAASSDRHQHHRVAPPRGRHRDRRVPDLGDHAVAPAGRPGPIPGSCACSRTCGRPG